MLNIIAEGDLNDLGKWSAVHLEFAIGFAQYLGARRQSSNPGVQLYYTDVRHIKKILIGESVSKCIEADCDTLLISVGDHSKGEFTKRWGLWKEEDGVYRLNLMLDVRDGWIGRGDYGYYGDDSVESRLHTAIMNHGWYPVILKLAHDLHHQNNEPW